VSDRIIDTEKRSTTTNKTFRAISNPVTARAGNEIGYISPKPVVDITTRLKYVNVIASPMTSLANSGRAQPGRGAPSFVPVM
jgi:hypothetical protein